MREQIQGQLSLFDIWKPDEQRSFDDILEDIVKRGSLFENGKERIKAFYRQDLTKTERAERIKDEYGIGGALGFKANGYKGFNSDARGLEVVKEYDKRKMYSWTQVETVICRLISAGTY